MGDLFNRGQQHNFFSRLPERMEDYRPDANFTPSSGLPETPEEYGSQNQNFEEIRRSWNENARSRREFREQMQAGPGAGLSLREYGMLYDWREQGLINDDDIYRIVASKKLGEYMGLPPTVVYEHFDALWQGISSERQDRYTTLKSRAEATDHSIQIAKNMKPLGRMGIELQNLHGRLRTANEAEREALQKRADELWEQITALRSANEELSRRMPTDALTTIITSTIQSAPLTLKSAAGGLAGGLAGGGIGALAGGGVGFAAGWRIGYGLGSFAASSSEMAGIMYIDLLAAGAEQENAADLAFIGGSLNGLIESGLGTVAGWGRSAFNAVGGRILSQEARAKIAEAASKSFIKRISTGIASSAVGRNALTGTLLETIKQAGGEGFEEVLQYLVEQAMFAVGDAMQDSPVERNLWGSDEFKAELRQSFIGGIAGGIGFGIAGLPLTISGNISAAARQTAQLKNLAVTIDDKAELRAAARENPLTRNLSDEQIDRMHDSQEGERQAYHQSMREEADRAGRRLASMPTLEAPGEMRRQADGRLNVRITSPETAGMESSGTLELFDPPTRQRMGSVEFSWDIEENAIAIESIDLSQAVTDREAVICDMVKELAYANPEMGIGWDPDEQMNEAAGVDLSALKDKLIAENPHGSDWNLQFYRTGDRFAQTRAMNEDINLIESTANVSRETASDIYEAWNTAFRNFGLNTHEMIGRMGLTSEERLRVTAAERPEGIEAQVTRHLDQGKIAAQKIGQVPAGGMVVIRQDENGGNDRILIGKEALNEAFDRLRAVTVLTEHANPSTLHHEWLHFMMNVVIPNSPRYRALLQEAVGKRMEEFTARDHERLAEQYEKYLRNGEAPTPGLKALFKRIAEALRQFVLYGNVSPELKNFFDRMLAGPDGAMLDGENRQAQSGEARSRARVQTDNEQQKAFAEMTSAQRILQSDLHTREEKAEILFAMKRADAEALENMEPIPVPIASITSTAAKETYKQIKQRQNKQTGQTAVFVNNSFDKIISHKGFDKRVIPILAEAFENAVHMYDEPVDTAYKAHDNFTGYSHYAAKIQIDGQPVYARFTLENLKAKPGKTPVSQFHSVHLSYEVKNNAAEPHVTSAIIKTATWGASGTTDLKLQQWLNFVKPNSENEMLFQTGWHGSPYVFDKLNNSYVGSGLGNLRYGWGYTLYSRKEAAEWFGQAVSKYKGAEGQLYQVDIPDDHELLHWEKPISEQPEVVQQAADKLISWKKDGTSDFNEAYNLRKFNDDSYGFYRSINGKMKWPTTAEAQAAAKEEIKKTLTGKEFYNTLAESIGAKETSLLLDHLGVKGTKYFDKSTEKIGVPKGYNYVIYGDSDVQIMGAPKVESRALVPYGMLFQMTRKDIQAEALRYSSWRKWMEAEIFAETLGWDKSFRQDDSALEPQAQQEIEAWYEKNWNEAQVLAREAALGDGGIRMPTNAEAVNPELLDEEYGSLDWDTDLYDQETNVEENSAEENGNAEDSKEIDDSESEAGKKSPITASEANRRLIEKLPRAIDDFLIIIGQTMRTGLEHFGAVTAEDVTARDQIERDKERIYKETHPYIRGLALRMSTGKILNDTQRRTAMSHIRRSLESGATVYRELYTSLTEDQEFVSYAENEVPDAGVQGEAQRAAAQAEGLTAFQRTRLAEKIIDKDIRRKIRAEKAENGEVIDYLKRADEEIREMDAEIKSIQTELEQSKGETAEERAEAERWYRQYLKIRTELKAAKKEAEQLNKKLERSKQTKANADERAKAGREKAETKLKEKLAAKQDEIRALQKRLKEDAAYAKKQGRMEKTWEWAEWRQKLDKKEAERKKKAAEKKALNKYLETNKKIASWIMSADRIGMNIWVRQRELILEIQNALFDTSKIAAKAREMDAKIKDVTRKLERERKRQAGAENNEANADARKTDAQRRIDKLEAELERLMSTKQYSLINQTAKKLEREKKNLEKLINAAPKTDRQPAINKYEAELKILKSEREQIEIMGPYLAGVETEQTGEGADTVDTGTIVFNGKTMSVEEFRQQFFENKIRYGFMDSKLRKALRTSAPSAKSLGEKRKWSAVNIARGMSQEDLLAVKAVIQQLNKEGRANWERRQFAIHFNQQELIKTFLFQNDELEKEEKKTGPIKRYIKAMQERDIEKRKRLLAKGEDFRRRWWEDWDDKRLIQMMDGDRKRALYNFIIRERLRYANRRDVAVEKRTGRILDMLGQGTPEQQAEEQNLSEGAKKRKVRERAKPRIKELGEKNIAVEGVGPRRMLREWEYGSEFQLEKKELMETPTNIDVSLADLMFLSVALDNKFSREHYLFGNLWSDDERAYYEKFLKEDGTMPADIMAEIIEIGNKKEARLCEAINQHLFEEDGKGGRKVKGELMRIVDAIRDDFEAH